MDVIPDEESDRGLEVLERAIELEKTGHSLKTLWGELLAACFFVSERVNILVQDYSDYLAQGFPKSDLMEYRKIVLMKTERHRHLLLALLEGGCFMNGCLNQNAAMTLFDNEERLASVLSVSGFLSDPLLRGIIEKAGSLLTEPSGIEESIEKVTDLEKFFALTKEAPHSLARAVGEACGSLITRPGAVESLQEALQIFKSLHSLIHGMLNSGEHRRRHLELHHRREGKALRQFRVIDWIHHQTFLSTWDTLLHAATKLMINAKDLEVHEAKELIHISLSIAKRLFLTLRHVLDNEVGEEITKIEDLPERFRNLQTIAGHYLCTIIACCFDEKRSSSCDEEIKKEVLSLAKDNCCYEAIFDLLYKYSENGVQLLQLMIHWDPTHRKSVRNSLTYVVFTKWIESGIKKDLEHLLNGPSALDGELVAFLKDHHKTDLVIYILIRMGHVSEVLRVLQMKGRDLTAEERSLLFVLRSADPMGEDLEVRSSYLQLRLESMIKEFELEVTHMSPVTVLLKLLSKLQDTNPRDQELKLMNSILDIFCCKDLEFIENYNEEWKTLWRFVGSSIKAKEVPTDSQRDGSDVLYPYEDFKLVCKACQELKLSIDEKQVILNEIVAVFGHHQSTHFSILNTLASLLDLTFD